MEKILNFLPELAVGTRDTLYMVGVSAVFSYLLGLPLGILLVLTARDGIAPNKPLNTVLGWIINLGRSIPFIIIVVALIPFTRLVVHTFIGPTAAIVPLVVAAAPFVARVVESSLKEIDQGVVEAAQAMGATKLQIIFKVLVPECIPSLVRGFSITAITLVGYSAMAGAVGGGGLGDLAIRYGFHRYQADIMMVTVVLLVVMVALIQLGLGYLAKRLDKRNRT
ncbi:methionine ABC transporter permease [Oscillospiraceae bacterium MB08-C2-2]|nr:methionine ABC transporter permease [Oscillospiraceae bacterium MB08-C2-2]